MMIAMALAALAAAPATMDTLQIGGTAVTVRIPAGFCKPTSPAGLAAAQLVAAADEANVTLATYVPCGKQDNFQDPDYYLIKAPKNALLQTVKRAEMLDELQKVMVLPQFTAPDADANNDKIEQQFEKLVGERPDMKGAVKPLGRDDTCVYMGGVLSFSAKEIAYERAVSSCITVAQGKILAIYRYSEGAPATNVTRHLASARAVARTMTE